MKPEKTDPYKGWTEGNLAGYYYVISEDDKVSFVADKWDDVLAHKGADSQVWLASTMRPTYLCPGALNRAQRSTPAFAEFWFEALPIREGPTGVWSTDIGVEIPLYPNEITFTNYWRPFMFRCDDLITVLIVGISREHALQISGGVRGRLN